MGVDVETLLERGLLRFSAEFFGRAGNLGPIDRREGGERGARTPHEASNPFSPMRNHISFVSALILAAGTASAQQIVGVPTHFVNLAATLEVAFLDAEAHVESADTLADFRDGYALSLLDASQAFLVAAGEARLDYPDEADPSFQQLIGDYQLCAFSIADTALALHLDDLSGASDHWKAFLSVAEGTLGRYGESYSTVPISVEVEQLLEVFNGLGDTLEIAATAAADVASVVNDLNVLITVDPLVLASFVTQGLNSYPAWMLEDLGWNTPEDLDDMLATWPFLTGDPALSNTLTIAQADPEGWIQLVALCVLVEDFKDAGGAAGALVAAFPDPLVVFSASTCECVTPIACPPDTCTTVGDACTPVQREISFGIGAWKPGKFEKFLKKAEKALLAADIASTPIVGPAKKLGTAIEGAQLGVKALRGLAKQLLKHRPVPHFRLCAKKCRSVDCGGWPFLGPNYKKCGSKNVYTEWEPLTNPPKGGPVGHTNPFAVGGGLVGWGTADDILAAPDDFQEATDAAIDNATAPMDDTDYFNANT